MIKKIIFFILFFYFLTLIQTSFLVHFNLSGFIPNLVLIAIFFINLFAPHHNWWGVGVALIGGFYLDIFSLNSFGFFGSYTLISLGVSLFLKFILRKHVEIPAIKTR